MSERSLAAGQTKLLRNRPSPHIISLHPSRLSLRPPINLYPADPISNKEDPDRGRGPFPSQKRRLPRPCPERETAMLREFLRGCAHNTRLAAQISRLVVQAARPSPARAAAARPAA